MSYKFIHKKVKLPCYEFLKQHLLLLPHWILHWKVNSQCMYAEDCTFLHHTCVNAIHKTQAVTGSRLVVTKSACMYTCRHVALFSLNIISHEVWEIEFYILSKSTSLLLITVCFFSPQNTQTKAVVWRLAGGLKHFCLRNHHSSQWISVFFRSDWHAYFPCIKTAVCVCNTFKYCMSLTEVSSGSPAVSIRANSVMKRFPFFLKIR